MNNGLKYFNLPLLSLFTPVICIVNFFFFLFWIYNFQWPLLLFVLFFFFNYSEWNLLFQFSRNSINTSTGLKLMSYNVRLFNTYKWIEKSNIPDSIYAFIKSKNPDIICFQEFDKRSSPNFTNYPFSYFKNFGLNKNIGSCILSKTPILNSGYIDFENSNNGAIFVDLKNKTDSLRVYNIHFESLGLSSIDSFFLDKKPLNKLNIKIKKALFKQKNQGSLFNNISSEISYPSIICTDLNNNAFSETYISLTKSRNDAFVKEGSGFGSTFYFGFFPLRVDYILVDTRIEILSFLTFNESFSDHKPIMVKVAIN